VIPTSLLHSGLKPSTLPTKFAIAFLQDHFPTTYLHMKPGLTLLLLPIISVNLAVSPSLASLTKFFLAETRSHLAQSNAAFLDMSATRSIASGIPSQSKSSSHATLSFRKITFLTPHTLSTFPNLQSPFRHHSTMSSTTKIAILMILQIPFFLRFSNIVQLRNLN
jgi:hypothetical protein